MPGEIYLDPDAEPDPVIQVGEHCYQRVGWSDQPITTYAEDIQETFTYCVQCCPCGCHFDGATLSGTLLVLVHIWYPESGPPPEVICPQNEESRPPDEVVTYSYEFYADSYVYDSELDGCVWNATVTPSYGGSSTATVFFSSGGLIITGDGLPIQVGAFETVPGLQDCRTYNETVCVDDRSTAVQAVKMTASFAIEGGDVCDDGAP